MPLVDYEAEVFAESGAWRNFNELEDSLSLDELLELYKVVIEKESRFIETMGKLLGGGSGGSRGSKTNAAGRPVDTGDRVIDIKPGAAGVQRGIGMPKTN